MLRLWMTTAAVAAVARAMVVAPGSPCATGCGNVLDATSPDDVVCLEGAYAGATGQLLAGCVGCEMRSAYRRDNASDVQAMLYNLRYTLSYCLFGNPVNKNLVDTPCITSKACGPFRAAIEHKIPSSGFTGFEYCDEWPVDDRPDLDGCVDCLQAAEHYYLANFVTVLQAGCQQKPEPGLTIGLDGDVFSKDTVKITAPSPTAAVDPAWFDPGPLNLGAKVGIAVSAFVLVLILVGCAIVLNGKRRRRAYLRRLETKYRQRGWPSPGARGDMSETPVSQRPLQGWRDSPSTASPGTDQTSPRHFSPIPASYQPGSPVNINQGVQTPATAPAQEIGIALSGDEGDGGRWAADASASGGKGKVREEAYEMHKVDCADGGSSWRPGRMPRAETPVLGHPGYGRTGGGPPAQHALSEDDARSGNAI